MKWHVAAGLAGMAFTFGAAMAQPPPAPTRPPSVGIPDYAAVKEGQPVDTRPPEIIGGKPMFPEQTHAPYHKTAPYKLTEITSGLYAPWALAFLPDGKFLVTEKLPGALRVIDKAGHIVPSGQANPRPILKRNQFGGTFGGPVTIPHVVNGKDKFFFFFAYQGQRQSSIQVNPQVTTFTPAELNGDFSHAAGGVPASLVTFLQTYPYFQPNAQLAAQGIIDPSRINPVTQGYISHGLIPTSPTGTLTPNGPALDSFSCINV